jgi:hypothetical protein
MRWAIVILVVGIAVGVGLFWVAPLLGGLVIVATVGAVGLVAGADLADAIGRMVAGYPPWRKRY